MSDTRAGPAPGDFLVGRVLNRSFELLFGDFLKFFATTLVIWVPFLLVTFFSGAYLAVAARNPQSINAGAAIGLVLVTLVLVLGLSILSQAVVLYGAFQKMRGRSFGIAESFAQGFARFLPILGLFVLIGLALMCAALLLIFPAFILMTMWYVALPACVLERKGPMDSLGRSSFLTRGYRWKVFGIYLIVFIVNTIVAQVLQRIVGAGIVGAIVNLLWVALFSAYQSIVVAVVYNDLRVAKEGVDTDRIAAVFD